MVIKPVRFAKTNPYSVIIDFCPSLANLQNAIISAFGHPLKPMPQMPPDKADKPLIEYKKPPRQTRILLAIARPFFYNIYVAGASRRLRHLTQ